MSVFYEFAYRFGFTPWEAAAKHGPAQRQILETFAREERILSRPGRVLDLGCGSGHWSVVLAQRGWDVTGIDNVGRAVARARQRAVEANVAARFIEGDVTRLADAGLTGTFQFVWDFGMLHGLAAGQRRRVADGLARLTDVGSTIATLAWAPAWRGPLPRGMSRAEIEADFPSWAVTDDVPFDRTGLPGPLRQVDPHLFRLQRV